MLARWRAIAPTLAEMEASCAAAWRRAGARSAPRSRGWSSSWTTCWRDPMPRGRCWRRWPSARTPAGATPTGSRSPPSWRGGVRRRCSGRPSLASGPSWPMRSRRTRGRTIAPGSASCRAGRSCIGPWSARTPPPTWSRTRSTPSACARWSASMPRRPSSAAGVLGTATLAATQEALRGDPQLHFAGADQIEAVAEASLGRAEAAVPSGSAGGRGPPCEVTRMLPHEEKHSTIAYYREPASDGSRPGRYYINTWQPATRPRYEAEALAFHEAVPGHHLQVAIAQELTGLPSFRRHAYDHRLRRGLGPVRRAAGRRDGPLQRRPRSPGHAQLRLVARLPPGGGHRHARAWLVDRPGGRLHGRPLALARNNIVNEVDRYLGRPGQALAYKIGQLEIVRLRSHPGRLGPRSTCALPRCGAGPRGPLPLETLAGSVAASLPARGSGVRVPHEIPHPRVVRRQEGLVRQQRQIGSEVGVEHHPELVDRAALVVESEAGAVDPAAGPR